VVGFSLPACSLEGLPASHLLSVRGERNKQVHSHAISIAVSSVLPFFEVL